MNKKTKKQLESIYKEVYANAYKKEQTTALDKEIARINKKAREDAKKALKIDVRYDPRGKSKKKHGLHKKVKKYKKSYKKVARNIQHASDKMLDDILGH